PPSGLPSFSTSHSAASPRARWRRHLSVSSGRSRARRTAHGEQVFTETRGEIERLLKEDPTLYERGGTAGAAQTGEEYRQTLRKALAENHDRIVNLPWKAGSGMTKAEESGVLFCAAVGPRTYLRYVRTDADWRPIEAPAD